MVAAYEGIEGGHPQPPSAALVPGALAQTPSHARRRAAVDRVGGGGIVVDEAQRPRGVAARQVVERGAQIRVRPQREPGLMQMIFSLVDDAILDEEHAVGRPGGARGKGALLHLEPQARGGGYA